METKHIIIVTFILIVVVVGVSLFFKLYDGWAFFGVLFYTGIFILFYVFLSYDEHKRKQEKKQKNIKKLSLQYAWERINYLLQRMAGGDGLEWDSGFGKKSEIKYFSDGKKQKPYRAVLGRLSNQGQQVIIIFDIDEDEIVKYNASPSPEQIINPFHDFDPYSQNTNISQYPRYDRYDKHHSGSRYNRGGLYPSKPATNNELSFDDMPASPNDDLVRKTLDKLDNGR